MRRPPERRSHALDEFTQVRGNLLSKAFAAARERAKAYAELPLEQRPAFRDLRAYGAWCYERKGFPVEYVQALMAHKTTAMTQFYQEGHDVKYVDVEAGL